MTILRPVRRIASSLMHRWIQLTKEKRIPQSILRRGFHVGYCPICETTTIFVKRAAWLRDHLICARCASIPRWRSIINVIETQFPNWREYAIHESSPGGAASDKLQRECPGYVPSNYYPDTPSGSTEHTIRCENLERMTFADEIFDLVITQDVLEHVMCPSKAFSEISRTLKHGGAHIFTVPWYGNQQTKTRALLEDGNVTHLEEPTYHANPIDPDGSLVVTDWGYDIADIIYRETGMTTTIIKTRDVHMGIDGQYLEVFISRKP